MSIFKKIAATILLGSMVLIMGGCINYTSTRKIITEEEQMTGLHHVELEIENYGTIALEIDADTAPISATRFLNLAQQGFYNGTKFHRIIKGFMMQGGEALTKGEKEQIKPIVGEFSSNGYQNDISHVRGTISMARTDNKNSATSQFFIVHEDSTYLDGNYAGFGHVTSGMEIVDEICNNVPQGDNGAVKADDQPVIKEIRVID